MIYAVGDIFDFVDLPLVIPTNQGYRRDGTNVMGAGVAKEAAARWPTLPRAIGEHCQRYKESAGVVGFSVFMPSAFLLAFPVKPLNREHPNLSWKNGADIKLIERSARELVRLVAEYEFLQVALPRVGCGNGGLRWEDVQPLLDSVLDERFTLVSRPEDV